ncbi:MAG: ATP phosphoribosyltransferase regulatory subunit [Caulobacter sp.]|nr:ATP phosphoribosyltransferase regulatory subunit [Caulobacter sp.]
MRLEPAIPPAALAAIRAPFEGAGTQIDVPVLQPLSLLLDLAGEAMRPRLFVVQAEGGEEAALRPDFTIPIARAHLASGAASGRYVYEGKAFRAAGGSDRAEEFLQLGLEAYGGADPVAVDAEVLSLAWRSARAGGRGDLSLLLGDVRLFAAFIADMALEPGLAARMTRAFGRPRLLAAELDGAPAPAPPSAPASGRGRLAALLAGLPEDQAVELLEEVWGLAGVSPVGGRPTAEIARRLAARGGGGAGACLTPAQIDAVRAFLAVEGRPAEALAALGALGGARLAALVADWRRRLEALEQLAVPAADAWFGAGFGRAFGYYDGPLFEVRSTALGADRPLAAGGRYDGLVARLGGAATGAVGCMVRPARACLEGGE